MAVARRLSQCLKIATSAKKNADLLPPVTTSAVRCRLMTKKDEKEVRQLCYHFWENEPVARAVGIEVPRECELGVDYLLQVAHKSQVSVVAEDINNKKLTGVGIFHILTRGDLYMWTDPVDDPNGQKMVKVEKIYAQTALGPDMCTELNVDSMMHGLAITVLPEYQEKGVAFGMMQFAIDIGTSLGIPLLIVESFNDYSRKIAKRLGFQKLKEVNLVDDETGDPIKVPGSTNSIVGSLYTFPLSAKNKKEE